MMLNPFRLVSSLYWAIYWFVNRPISKYNPSGRVNPQWLEWYQWKFKVDREKALSAFSILSYRVAEPYPFKETKEWERWYREVNSDKTITRAEIKDRLTRFHLTAKTASFEKEPPLLTEYKELNLKWAKWYRNMNGTTLFKAKIVGYQKMAEMGIWSKNAHDSHFNRPEPDLNRTSHWVEWYSTRYQVSKREANVAHGIQMTMGFTS